MSRAIASIDMPAWPPWPWPCGVARRARTAAWSCGAVAPCARPAGRRRGRARTARRSGSRTPRTQPRRSSTDVARRVEGDGRGLRDRVGLDGQHARPARRARARPPPSRWRSAARRRAGPSSRASMRPVTLMAVNANIPLRGIYPQRPRDSSAPDRGPPAPLVARREVVALLLVALEAVSSERRATSGEHLDRAREAGPSGCCSAMCR